MEAAHDIGSEKASGRNAVLFALVAVLVTDDTALTRQDVSGARYWQQALLNGFHTAHVAGPDKARSHRRRLRATTASIDGSSSPVTHALHALPETDVPRTSSAVASSPFRVASTIFALISGACCLRFDISDLLLVEVQQIANCSLRQCPNFGVE
jgi:hypothetical protein